MTHNKNLQIAFISLFLILNFNITKSYALEDAIVAIVNDELVTLKDLRDYVHATYISLIAEGIPQSQLKEAMRELETNGITKLIEDKLILSKANQLGLVVRDKIVNDRLKDIKAKYPSEQVFLNSLMANGATITDLRNKIKDQMKIKYVIENQVRAKIFVNPQEVTKYYNEHIESYKNKEQVNVESIFIPFETTDKTETYKRAYEAQNLIQGGKDFMAVTLDYSSTPSLGKVERGQLKPDIENKIFNMNIGDISEPVEVENGLYIFKCVDQFPAQTLSLEEVKDKITDAIFREKFKKQLSTWLTKLKKDAYIEIKK